MYKTFIFIMVLLFTQAAQAQVSAVANPAGEKISMSEISFNFGKIPQGKPVTHIFLVTNTSTEAITLDNVQASCGCTTPEWDHKPIAPGATSEIKVGYNAQAEGTFDKNITIFYDKGKMKVFSIKGEVWRTPDQPAPRNTSTALLKNIN